MDETQTAVDETQTAVELDELLRDFGSLEAPTRDAFRALVRELRQKDMTSVPLIGLPGSSVDIAETGTIVRRTPVSDLLDSGRVRVEIANVVQSVGAPEAVDVIERRVLAIVQPTLILDMKRTQRMQEAAEASVSRTTGLVRKGEVLVSKGEVLTEESIAKLINYGYLRDESSRSSVKLTTVIGSLLHASLVYSLLVLFVYFLRRKIYGDNLQLLSLSALITSSAVFSWATLLLPREFSVEFLVLIPACAMVAAIYFDSRTGFIVTVTSSLMYAGVRANDAGGALALIIAGTLGAYSVRDLRTRTQLFRSIGFILIGFVLVITAMILERGGSIPEQWRAYAWAVVNAVVSPLLTFAVIAVTERYFGVMTDLTLREYDNVNHPLLVQMSEKAPGTYQHTLAIAHLVESAAYGIEASPLLARVGAYYHDIGKIAKSEYFIENQIELDNKHDRLTPKKSAAIIRNHVADGMEMAREYGLPEKIIDFI
ncbi:MAG: HDIG domain-containing metalloprotein, partial [Candidatus Kapaibacterium sp.]